MNSTNIQVFRTSNRHLEGFLFMHKVRFIRQERTPDGCTCWIYIRNEKFEKVFEEYKELYPNHFSPLA